MILHGEAAQKRAKTICSTLEVNEKVKGIISLCPIYVDSHA